MPRGQPGPGVDLHVLPPLSTTTGWGLKKRLRRERTQLCLRLAGVWCSSSSQVKARVAASASAAGVNAPQAAPRPFLPQVSLQQGLRESGWEQGPAPASLGPAPGGAVQGSGGVAAPAQGPAGVWHGQELPPRSRKIRSVKTQLHIITGCCWSGEGGRAGYKPRGLRGAGGARRCPEEKADVGWGSQSSPQHGPAAPQPHCPAAVARICGRRCRGAGGCGCFPASRPGVAEPRRADNRLWLFSHPAGIRLHGPGIFFPSFHSLSLETFRILPLISPLCLPSRSAQTGLEAEVSAFSIPNTQKHQ